MNLECDPSKATKIKAKSQSAVGSSCETGGGVLCGARSATNTITGCKYLAPEQQGCVCARAFVCFVCMHIKKLAPNKTHHLCLRVCACVRVHGNEETCHPVHRSGSLVEGFFFLSRCCFFVLGNNNRAR